MPHRNSDTSRGTNNMGSIRKKTKVQNGKKYTYWEARYTAGYDPETGKQIQKSISGKTQKEVKQKMAQAISDLDSGTYISPTKLTLNDWLDTWEQEYLNGVKPRTAESYRDVVRLHIRPRLGKTKLEQLDAHAVQLFINGLSKGHNGLSPKSVKNVHSILHCALQRAVINRIIPYNPAHGSVLPKSLEPPIRSLEPDEIKLFLNAISGHRLETLYKLALYTGMRQGELLGLTWEYVNFQKGSIQICQQLVQTRENGRKFSLGNPKSSKSRTIFPGKSVMALLQEQKEKQKQLFAELNMTVKNTDFVFTNEVGKHYTPAAVYCAFKKIAVQIGMPHLRFHDLRHTYATNAICTGIDIKAVSSNLGHATVAFTLDKYTDVIQQMHQNSSTKWDQFVTQMERPV